jgi:hypothetical protein
VLSGALADVFWPATSGCIMKTAAINALHNAQVMLSFLIPVSPDTSGTDMAICRNGRVFPLGV